MKILLVQSLAYIPSHGGANKANRILIEGLAARGHLCRVVAAAAPVPDADARTRLLEELAARGISAVSAPPEKVVFRHRGVEVHTLISGRHIHAELQRRIREFEPTWTLVSSEDPGQSLLETALGASPTRVVSVVQTTLALPFGPAAFLQSPGKAELFRRAAGVITISRYMRDYLRRWGAIESAIIRFPVYGPGPFPSFGNYGRGSVTMINPSGLKGISIFTALARQMPDVQFTAVVTWGTTAEDRRGLEQLPNVRLIPPADDMDEVLSQTRVLLVPSLWGEVFGYVVVDAMLRGIPVLASDVGGVPEAKLGVDYVLPVSPITRYEERLDEHRLPVPVIPPQDTRPWSQALQRLISEREHYERLSRESSEAALSFVSKLSIEPFEKYLESLSPAPATPRVSAGTEAPGEGGAAGRLDALSPERRALLAMLLKEKRAQAAPDVIPRREQSEPLRLSFAQQRLWFLQQLEPNSALYNIPAAVRLKGPLNVAALRQSLDELIRRHEALRTTFVGLEDEPVQVIHTKVELSLATLDLCALPPDEREPRLRGLMLAEAQQPFDLSRGPLLRARLLRFGEDEHVLLLTMHHIVSDGWSIGILIREIGALYEAFSAGRPSPLAPLPIQYADFAVWQRRRLTGEALEEQLGYWRRQLGGDISVPELPADKPRPAVRTYHGAKFSAALPDSLSDELKALSRRHACTLFMTMLAAFDAMLYRYTGRTDIAVGTPIAGRNRAETEGLIGFFINTLVLRADLSGEPTFTELLARVKGMALEAYAHQDVPFEKMVAELSPERSLSHTPFFNVMFALHNMPMPVMHLAGVSLDVLPTESATAKFDLMLSLEEVAGELTSSWVYSTDLFEAATVERMAGHYQRLLEGIVADPAARVASLPLLSEDERRRLLVEWNDTSATRPGVGVLHELFEAQVERTPEATALVFGDEQLTFAELNARANQLAHHLRGLSVGPETLVGIIIERSPEMIVGLLGVLKAGGAYVPIDPAYPPQRIALTVEDARIKVLLIQQRLLQSREGLQETFAGLDARVVCLDSDLELIERERAENPNVAVSDENPAYVIYTSGSTGRPKGVMIRNGAAVNLFAALHRAVYARHASPLRVGMNAPLAFDASVKQWVQLLAGHTLVLVPEELRADGDDLLAYAAAHRVDSLDCTPSQLKLLMSSASWQTQRLPSLMLVGGEAIDVETWEQLGSHPRVDFHNVYGPTECTVDATAARVREAGQTPNIGRPLANVRVYILDAGMRPVPVGVAGELYVGGDGLARGYLNRPALTAERFVPDPFSREAGTRLYRTGDLARYLTGGEVEYLGRSDHQVKVRGFRVELGEIEAAVGNHEQVRECAVIVHARGSDDVRLVAFVVAEAEGLAVTASRLRTHLKQQLPEHMIPASFIPLDSLPLTPNGKLDRRRLGELADGNAREGVGEFVEARTPTEEVLVRIWAEVLGVEQVGAHDNFFELGGHSLLATRITFRIRAAFGVEVPLRSLFESPTVAEMAEHVEQSVRERLGLELPPVTRTEGDAEPMLSFAQRRLWFLGRLEPESPSYNIAAAIRLSGELMLTALEMTFTEITRRHESLRTIFPSHDGRPVQRILPVGRALISFENLTEMPAGSREAEMRRMVDAEAHRPFDLARGPLLRITLLRLAEDEHVLLLVMHHIISDGWSLGLLVREVAALYKAFSEGEASPLTELPVQYADFAAWQHRWMQGETLEKQLAYWTEQLAGVPPLQLPTDRPRPAIQSYQGARRPFELSAATTAALERLSRQEGVTFFMTLMAAFQAFLYRYTQQDDVAVGTPVAGRNRAETESLIGCFINTLVFRTKLAAGMTFRELLSRVKETALGAYAHQDAPFEALVEQLQPERSLSHSPLFQVMFSLQNAALPSLDMQGLTLEPLDIEFTAAKFDLTLNLLQQPQRVGGFIEYNTDLFDAATIDRMAEEFRTLLEGVAAAPGAKLSALPLLPATELHKLLVEFNRTRTDADYARDECLHQLFERQARLTPDAVAVSFGGSSLTYSELDRKANRLARYLRRSGVGRETLVGICVERSIEMVAGLLGILKAGGAYLPLDVTYPRERLAFILEDAGASVLLTQSSATRELPAHSGRVVCIDAERAAIERESEEPPARETTGSDLAYVIYTSGSTGRPKGVCIPHSAVVNFLTSMRERPGLTERDVLLSVTTLSFDIAGLELFLPLAVGARVEIAGRAEGQNGARLAELLASSGATVMQATPSTWRLLLAAGWQGDERLKILCGGESLPAELADQLLERCGSLWNLYGPTESTIWSSAQLVAPTDEAVLIGTPIANTQIYLLDASLQPVPLGAYGELYIGGAGLAGGYLRRPGLTAERFIPHPFGDEPGARLYRTGDLARHRAQGKIEYLGRLDNQVKLRGHRIELGEIEAVLGRHPAVRECAVVIREERPGHQRLAAYIVVEEGESPPPDELHEYLGRELPVYMIPSVFTRLEAMPLTPNGKLDRRALPTPTQARADADAGPQTPAEKVLTGIFSQVLGVEQVGGGDDFFRLGGHSLLVIELLYQIREVFRAEPPLRDFLARPTVQNAVELLTRTWGERETVEKIAQTYLELEELSEQEMEMLLAEEDDLSNQPVSDNT